METVAGEGGFAVRRQRECLACRRQYTTFERSEERTIKVIKKDGTRAPFERQKSARPRRPAGSVRSATHRSKRSSWPSQNDVHARPQAEVLSSHLGELVMEHLRRAGPGGLRSICQRISAIQGRSGLCRRTGRHDGQAECRRREGLTHMVQDRMPRMASRRTPAEGFNSVGTPGSEKYLSRGG